MKYIIFGAGLLGKSAIDLIGRDNIDFFIDNDKVKQKKGYNGFNVLSLEEAIPLLNQSNLVIAVSKDKENEIRKQLEENGIKSAVSLYGMEYNLYKDRVTHTIDYLEVYRRAIKWIEKHSLKDGGIAISSSDNRIYPEVSGYYIPTLLKWGYRDLAIKYAKRLIEIQRDDGGWNDPEGKNAYIFDTAQIIKGLNSIKDILPEAQDAAVRGADWILSNIDENGRLTTPSEEAWGDINTCSELVHIYCLSPLVEISDYTGNDIYRKAANRALDYYLKNYKERIVEYSHLIHFHAYIAEGLIDMRREDIASEVMNEIAKYQKDDGAIGAYNNCNWICSTGLFQVALIWYRLGELQRANKTFNIACSIQNQSGGWFGSYILEDNSNETNDYFPVSEISWANKYFLDALYWKTKVEFESYAPIFPGSIEKTDGRYEIVNRVIKDTSEKMGGCRIRVADIGCGKGRYIKNLISDGLNVDIIGIDISNAVLDFVHKDICVLEGTLTNIPLTNNYLDLIYTCEALEHAIDVESAIREMARVTRSGGRIVIIDKNSRKSGQLNVTELEQWFDVEVIKNILLRVCDSVETVTDIPYENHISDGLFCAWIGTVR